MSTTSTIAMEQPDGRVMQIYCHCDGYLSCNGEILQQHYKDQAKVLALMLLGDLYSLGNKIGQQHDLNAVSQDCTAYGRDGGQAGTEARVYASCAEYRKQADFEEFNYLFRKDGRWYVDFHGEYSGRLDQALQQEEFDI